MEVELACRAGVSRQRCSAAIDDDIGLGYGSRSGGGIHGHDLRTGACAAAGADAHGVGDLIVTGLGVGMAHGLAATRLSVAEVPLVARNLLARRSGGGTGELGRSAFADRGEGEVRCRLAKHLDGLGDLAGAMSSASYGEGDLVAARVGIGVCGVRPCACLSITEVPVVALYLLSRGVCGGSAGELGGGADTYRGEVEVGGRHGIDDHIGGGAIGLATHGDGAGVGAGHVHRAVRTGGVLLGAGEPPRTGPTVSGARLSVRCQLNGFAHAVGTAIVDQRRQDAAVRLAITCIFLEGNVAATSVIVGYKENIVLSYLSINHVSILVGLSAETTVMKVAGRIEIGVRRVVGTTGAIRSQQTCLPRCCRTWVGLVAERTPKREVNVERCFHLDGDVTGNTNSHIVPEGMFARGGGT